MAALNLIPIWALSDQRKLVFAIGGIAFGLAVLVFLFGGRGKK